MSKSANKKAIGVFVLGAIALLVVALVVFGSGKIFKKTIPVVFYFEGSVKGLNIGSAVMLRGVQVGSVTNVVLQFNPQDLSLRIPVYAHFDPEKIERTTGEMVPARERPAMMKRLIDQGLRARLEMQSLLTGLLMINLDFLPKTPVHLVGAAPKLLEIPTIPTTMEVLSEKLQKLPYEEVFNKLASAVSGIDRTINSPEIAGGTKNLAQTLEEVKKLVKNINAEIKPLFASVQETMKDARNVLKNADNQIAGTASRLEALTGDARKLVQNVDRQVEPLASGAEGTLEALKKTLEEARRAIAQAQKTLQAAEEKYAGDSAFYYELMEALSGVNEASRSISLLGEYLKRQPDSVLWGKGKPGGK